MEFPKPKLKQKRGASFQSLSTEEGTSCKCSGVLAGGSVLVQNSADIMTLLSNGFYGKGVFSRSVPTHVQTMNTGHRMFGSEERAGAKPPRKRAKVSDNVLLPDSGEEDRRKRRLLLHAHWREEKEKLLASHQQDDSKKISKEKILSEHQITKREVVITEDSDAGNDGAAALSEQVEPCEPDLYPVAEPLCLSSEEAFYLVTEKELLIVHTPTAPSILSAEELWKELCANCKRFPFTYFAYHHYRKMGWVPKSGFKFGVDFILYKDGPEFYHSSYAVLVCEKYGGTAEVDCDFNFTEATAPCGTGVEVQSKLDENPTSEDTGLLKWTDIIAHCRVCESSGKELVVANVTVPSPNTTPFLSSPNCVQFMTLHEVLVTRWQPEKDR